MAKDDFFRLVYYILLELYESKKQGCRVNIDDISSATFGIPDSYWIDIMSELKDNGYIKGVSIRKTKGIGRVINCDDIDITMKGIEYLKENSMMKKIKKALKGLKDIVPVSLP